MISSHQYRTLIYQNNGTNPFFVLYAIQVFLDIYVCNILVDKLTPRAEIIINFTTIMIPCILRTLIPYNKYFLAFNILQITIISILHKNLQPINTSNKSLLTNLRSSLFLLTSIAILAVDFRIFYISFAKTLQYGYSLMDTGVGLFALINGLSHKTQQSYFTLSIMFLLGIGRFFSVAFTNYKVNITEYGIHWNFFLTLFCLKLIALFIPIKYSLSISIVTAILHEFILENLNLKQYIFSHIIPRSNFIHANREGIFSLPGYLSIYTFGIYLKRHFKNSKIILTFFILFIISSLFHFIINNYFNLTLSRKLVNLSYSLWIATIFSACTLMNAIIPTNQAPLIFRTINYNPLSYFLVANLFTGIINLCFDTLSIINETVCFFIILIYCTILFFIFYTLYLKNIKIF